MSGSDMIYRLPKGCRKVLNVKDCPVIHRLGIFQQVDRGGLKAIS